MTGTREELSFGDAMERLEVILRRIEGEEIDIDELAAQLQQAADLLEICRGKLRKAEVEVTQIVEKLDEADTAGGGEPADPESGPDMRSEGES